MRTVSHESVFDAVDQGLEAGVDDIIAGADRVPLLLAVAGLDKTRVLAAVPVLDSRMRTL